MTYPIRFTEEAAQDLEEIGAFIRENDCLEKAISFSNQLIEAISSLSSMPKRFRKSYYDSDPFTHDLIFKGYTVVYHVDVSAVTIRAIFRSKNY